MIPLLIGLVLLGLLCLLIAGIFYSLNYKKNPSTPEDRQQKLQDEKYSPDMNRFAARKETKAAAARTEVAKQINLEANAVTGMKHEQTNLINAETLKQQAELTQDAQAERFRRQLDVERAQHQTWLQENELTQNLLTEASEQKVDMLTYLELKKKVEMDRLELQKQWQEAENALKAGFIFQLQAHQHLALMTEYIGKLYDRAQELKLNGKDREYRLIEEHIEFMEGDFRGRQRLLQTDNREEVRGGDEDTEPSGNGGPTVSAEPE